MTGDIFESWEDLGLFALFKNPFLWPSLAIHLVILYLALGIKTLPLKEINTPVPIQLLEFGEGGSPDKSVGPGRGPGGPRTIPKLGNPLPPQQAMGKLDKGSTESSTPSEEPLSPPKAPVLPGPKIVAGSMRPEPFAVKETTPDSLVQLPTRESAGKPPAPGLEASYKNLATLNEGGDSAGIRALKEGAQIPGALKGTGTGAGPYGVPGGSRAGTGITGGGTGVGTGGGSYTGLKGAASADYDQYFKQIEKRVRSVWQYPDNVTGLHTLRIRFTVDRAGKLLQAEIMDSTDARLNASAIEAMRRASPFPPLPESIKELAGEPLGIRFTVGNRVRG